MRLNYILLTFLLCISGLAKAQFFVASGETVKVTAADELQVQENLVNNGTIDFLTLSGTVAQSISGTGTIGNLKISKSALTNVATITGGMQSITGVLDPVAGTLAAGTGFLTLKSSATATARVASHTNTGAVTGTVFVERYIAANSRKKQWRMLGFPYSTSVTLSDLSGFAIDISSSTPSIMYYNEGADDGRYGASSTGRNSGYVSFTNLSSQITSGTGVMAWLYGTAAGTASTGTNTGNLTILSKGTLIESGNDVSVNLSYSSGNTNNGWNLVANPFASAINWNSGITKTNLDASVYRFDPQAEGWTTHNGTTGTNSADNIIESGGAFFVKVSSASPVLTITQSAKVSGGSTFTHFRKSPWTVDMAGAAATGRTGQSLAGIRMSVSGQGNPASDEVYLDFSRTDATPGFDGKYDAESMGRSLGAGLAVKGEKEVFHAMQFDRPISEAGVEKRYYPLRVTSPAKGATTLELWTEGNWNPLNSVSLIDNKEGKTFPLNGGRLTYPFTMEELKSEGRFMLAINHVRVDETGRPSSFDVRLMGNPVEANVLSLLITHPTAAARGWSVLSADGRMVGKGTFPSGTSSVQHRLNVPGLQHPGSYVVKVEMENGDEKVIPFIRK